MKHADLVAGTVYAYKRGSNWSTEPVRVIDDQRFKDAPRYSQQFVLPDDKGQQVRALRVNRVEDAEGYHASVTDEEKAEALASIDFGGLLTGLPHHGYMHGFDVQRGDLTFTVEVKFVRLATLLHDWATELTDRLHDAEARAAYEADKAAKEAAKADRVQALREALSAVLGDLGEAGATGFTHSGAYAANDQVKVTFDADKLVAALAKLA